MNNGKLLKRSRFVCTAAAFTGPSFHGQMGFKIDLTEDDPRLWKFRNESFTETALDPTLVSTSTSVEAPADDGDKTPTEVTGDTLLEDLDILTDPILTILKDAEYGTVEDVRMSTAEELLAIKGIGQATVDKLMEACSEG